MISIACIGIGDWGRNLARNFSQLNDVNLLWCCDINKLRLEKLSKLYPNVQLSTDYQRILDDKKVEAVVIASSSSTHYQLAREALLAEKHVFVEKPLTLKATDAQDLINLSNKFNKKLMVGHLLKYHPAVEKLKELSSSGQLGKIYYIYSQRVNLGRVRSDENALWSFAPHDISVILYLLESEVEDVSARGQSYLQPGIADVVFMNLHFKDKKMANIQLSWLDPHKERKITIVGSKKMAVFDDCENTEKIKIHDKGADVNAEYVSYGDFITLRFGDIIIPRIDMVEPLRLECQHFIDCIKYDRIPKSDGKDGLQVVKILEAAQKSLDQDGIPVKV